MTIDGEAQGHNRIIKDSFHANANGYWSREKDIFLNPIGLSKAVQLGILTYGIQKCTKD